MAAETPEPTPEQVAAQIKGESVEGVEVPTPKQIVDYLLSLAEKNNQQQQKKG